MRLRPGDRQLLAGGTLFGLTVLAHAWYAPFVPFPGMVDASYYFGVGKSLAEGQGFTTDLVWNYLAGMPARLPVPSNDYWQPLTSVVLAGFFGALGPSWAAAQLYAIIFSALAAVAAYAFSCLLFPRRWLAFLAALPFCFYPLIARATNSDTVALTAFLATAALYCVARACQGNGRWLAAFGLTSGLAYLTRSDGALLLFAGLIAWLALTHKPGRWRTAGWVLVAFAIPVLPWVLRNWLVLGSPTPPGLMRSALLTSYPQLFSAHPEEIDLNHLLSRGLSVLASQRAAALTYCLRVLVWALKWPILLLICWTMLRRFREPTHLPVLLLSVLLTGVASLIFPFPATHNTFAHMLPALLPVAFPLALYGLWDIGAALRVSGVARNMVTAIGAGALAMAFAWWLKVDGPFVQPECLARRTMTQEVIAWLGTVGNGPRPVLTTDPWSLNYLAGIPSLVCPTDSYESVVMVAQRFGAAHLVVGQASLPMMPEFLAGAEADTMLVYLGRLPSGTMCYRFLYPECTGTTLTPLEVARAQARAGRALDAAGDLDSAVAAFRKAVKAAPEVGEARGDLGVALARSGRLAEAVPVLRTALGMNPRLHQARVYLDYCLEVLEPGSPKMAAPSPGH